MRRSIATPLPVFRSDPSTIRYFSNMSDCLSGELLLAEELGEHGVLATYLLDAVYLVGVFDMPVTLVFAGEVSGVSALGEHVDDFVIVNAVLVVVVDHVVELGLNVE